MPDIEEILLLIIKKFGILIIKILVIIIFGLVANHTYRWWNYNSIAKENKRILQDVKITLKEKSICKKNPGYIFQVENNSFDELLSVGYIVVGIIPGHSTEYVLSEETEWSLYRSDQIVEKFKTNTFCGSVSEKYWPHGESLVLSVTVLEVTMRKFLEKEIIKITSLETYPISFFNFEIDFKNIFDEK